MALGPAHLSSLLLRRISNFLWSDELVSPQSGSCSLGVWKSSIRFLVLCSLVKEMHIWGDEGAGRLRPTEFPVLRQLVIHLNPSRSSYEFLHNGAPPTFPYLKRVMKESSRGSGRTRTTSSLSRYASILIPALLSAVPWTTKRENGDNRYGQNGSYDGMGSWSSGSRIRFTSEKEKYIHAGEDL